MTVNQFDADPDQSVRTPKALHGSQPFLPVPGREKSPEAIGEGIAPPLPYLVKQRRAIAPGDGEAFCVNHWFGKPLSHQGIAQVMHVREALNAGAQCPQLGERVDPEAGEGSQPAGRENAPPFGHLRIGFGDSMKIEDRPHQIDRPRRKRQPRGLGDQEICERAPANDPQSREKPAACGRHAGSQRCEGGRIIVGRDELGPDKALGKREQRPGARRLGEQHAARRDPHRIEPLEEAPLDRLLQKMRRVRPGASARLKTRSRRV